MRGRLKTLESECNQETIIKSGEKKIGHFQKLTINKKSTTFNYRPEIWQKLSTQKVIIFTKFHEDRTKIVDFLIMAKF